MFKLTLVTDSQARKSYPIWRGCIAYFTAALAGVARHSYLANEKHNPGEPVHWSRGKSNDHLDCIGRHLLDVGEMVTTLENSPQVPGPGQVEALLTEANALAWRSLALSQELHERYAHAPVSVGSRLPKVSNQAELIAGSPCVASPGMPDPARGLGAAPSFFDRQCKLDSRCNLSGGHASPCSIF